MYVGQQQTELSQRIGKVLMAAALVVTFGTLGFWALDQLAARSAVPPAPTKPAAPTADQSIPPGHATLMDCLFQTFVIVSTLGVEKTDSLKHVFESTHGRLFAMLLMVLGMGVATYAFAELTAFIVGGELSSLLGRKRMDREIAKLNNHYIVCGAGRTGAFIISELATTLRPFVVIDTDADRLKEVAGSREVLYLIGDAHEEEVLKVAGIDRASGLLASLASDRDNLFLVITARQLKPSLRIIARGYELSARDKLMRAGADNVTYPNFIGGMRMVSEMVRPEATSFLDQMLREAKRPLRVEQVVVREGSQLVGKTLANSQIREKTGLLVVGCRESDGPLVNNPPAQMTLKPGIALIVLGEVEQLPPLRAMAGEA